MREEISAIVALVFVAGLFLAGVILALRDFTPYCGG